MQNFNNYTNPMFNNGYAYSVNKPKAQNTQPLTPEMAKALQKEPEMDMRIDEKEIWRSRCTHKDPSTHANVVTIDADGMCYCPICGEHWNWYTGNEHDVEGVISNLNDIFQTLKASYLDVPVDLANNFYGILALLKKLPTMWKLGTNNFMSYAQYSDDLNLINSGYGNGFNALNSMLSNPYAYANYGQQMMGQPMMGGMMPQQPMMQQPMMSMPQQPMMGGMMGQPMMQQPMMAQPAPDMNNPMAYGAPQTAPAPGVVPAAPAAAPAAQAEVKQQKQMSV